MIEWVKKNAFELLQGNGFTEEIQENRKFSK